MENISNIKGNVHSIETMGLVDGPGTRTIFFLQGCPLRCQYCHNPDTQDPNQATETMTPEEVLETARRYRPYLGQDGGISFSGGEPMLQGEFLYQSLLMLKDDGFNTAVDTSGTGSSREFSRILPLVDTLLLDVKAFDEKSYKDLCGGDFKSYEKFLDSIKTFGFKGQIWIRHVMVPGYTDNEESMEKLIQTIDPILDLVERIEILPYHTSGVSKYKDMGLDYKLEGVLPMDKDIAKEFEIYANRLFSEKIKERRQKKERLRQIENDAKEKTELEDISRIKSLTRDLNLSLFKDLDKNTQREVFENSDFISYKRNEMVFKSGDPADFMYVLLTGELKIYENTIDGKEQILYIYRPGDFVGAHNLLEDTNYVYNGRTLTQCDILEIPRKTFDRFLIDNPIVLHNLLAKSFERIRWAEDFIHRLSVSNASMKTAGLLLKLKNSIGQETEDGYMLSLNINREELGSYSGLTRETITRKLGEFKDLGYIDLIGNKKILIKDLEALEDFVF